MWICAPGALGTDSGVTLWPSRQPRQHWLHGRRGSTGLCGGHLPVFSDLGQRTVFPLWPTLATCLPAGSAVAFRNEAFPPGSTAPSDQPSNKQGCGQGARLPSCPQCPQRPLQERTVLAPLGPLHLSVLPAEAPGADRITQRPELPGRRFGLQPALLQNPQQHTEALLRDKGWFPSVIIVVCVTSPS